MFSELDPKFEHSEVTNDLAQYIFIRDNNFCGGCGGVGEQIHHVKFRSQGGTHKANNLILLCLRCHDHNKNLSENSEKFYRTIERNENRLRDRII